MTNEEWDIREGQLAEAEAEALLRRTRRVRRVRLRAPRVYWVVENYYILDVPTHVGMVPGLFRRDRFRRRWRR